MLDRRLPTAMLFMTRRFLKTFFNFLIFAALIGWWADLARGQDSIRAIPDSTVGVHQKFSRDLWLGKDKFDHALASAGLVAAQFYVLHQELEVRGRRSRQIAAGSTLTIGIAKEIYDKVSRRGTPSWKDLLADCVGVALAVGIMTQ
jgi:putative lipoprotein